MVRYKYPTLKEIRDAHGWKRKYERYLPLSRYLFRHLGFLVTWLSIRIGLTSEAVSWISGFVGLVGFICLMGSHEQLLPVGIGLLMFFNLLDCVDGSIARVMNTQNPYGRFLDSLMGWIDMGFWAVIGVMAYRHPELLHSPDLLGKGVIVWLAIGGLTCFFFIIIGYIERIFDELLREEWNKLIEKDKVHQINAFKSNVMGDKKSLLQILKNIIREINNNLRVRETHYFLLILTYWGKVVDLFLAGFLFYYAFHTLLLIIIYSVRGKTIRLKYHAS